MVVILLMEDAAPFSFHMMASAPAAISAPATASSASAAAPWLECDGLGGQETRLWESACGLGFSWVFSLSRPKTFRGLACKAFLGLDHSLSLDWLAFADVFLLILLFHAHPEVIV
jgi:hypothetical protein